MKKLFLLAGLWTIIVLSCDKNNMEKVMMAPPVATIGTVVVEGANNGGNITCEEVSTTVGCEFEYSSGRLDYEDYPTGGTVGPITWTTDGKYVSWTSTLPVKVAIIVKGGNTANVYFEGCNECLESGSGLSAPINPNNGKPYGLSNITFCYSICDENEDGCETAFALKTVASYGTCFLNLGFNRWGWTNGPIAISMSSTYYYLYAGAGQCDVSKGTLVGMIHMVYSNGTAQITLNMYSPYVLDETHLYIGNAMLPMNNGSYTVAPGQYPYSHDLSAATTDSYTVTGLSGNIYIIFHAVVCGF